MAAEDLFANDGGHREAVEAVHEGLPKPDVVTALALVVESVNSADLVVAAQQEEVFRVLDLVSQEEADGLHRLRTYVYRHSCPRRGSSIQVGIRQNQRF